MKNYFYFILLTIYSCTFSNKNSGEIHEIKDKLTSLNKIIIKNDTLYLIGEKMNMMDMDIQKDEAIVYFSKDFGKNWEKIYNDKGEIVDAYLISDSLFIFKKTYYDSSLGNSSLSLINFENKSIIHQFKKNSSVKSIFIDDSEKGILIIGNSLHSHDYTIFKTNNNFITYDSTHLNKEILKTFLYKDKIYFSSFKNRNKREWIYSFNTKKQLDSLYFNFDISDFVVDDNENVWLLSKNEKTFELSVRKKNVTKIISSTAIDENSIPEKIYKYDDFIAVLISSVDKSMLGGFGVLNINYICHSVMVKHLERKNY